MVSRLSQQTPRGLCLKAPIGWGQSQADTHSLTWEEPRAAASLSLSVYPVDPQRPAQACLTQLVEALGKEGFAAMTLGAQPASKKVTIDFIGQGQEAKVDAKKVSTATVLGCDGKTKWVLTWTAKVSESARFEPLFKRVLDSISYGKR